MEFDQLKGSGTKYEYRSPITSPTREKQLWMFGP
jgi:hypothetical protein